MVHYLVHNNYPHVQLQVMTSFQDVNFLFSYFCIYQTKVC